MQKKVKHEFIAGGEFIPRGSRYLVIGTFPSVLIKAAFHKMHPRDLRFYYGGHVNAFWNILSGVYGIDLVGGGNAERLKKIKSFLSRKHIALTDIVFSCRSGGRAGDEDLEVLEWNRKLPDIIADNPVRTIYFTGLQARRWTLNFLRDEKGAVPAGVRLNRRGPGPERATICGKKLDLVTLYSPSPRARVISEKEKTALYKRYLPS